MAASIFDTPVLEQVLKFTQARHDVIAGNIANIDTPGYRARDLSPTQFQADLKEAIAASHAQRADPVSDAADANEDPFTAVSDTTHTLVYHDNSNIDLEHEALELSKNQMQFNLALSLLTSQFHTLQAAISERA
jgi:flagellar basal-body rod protein FlgB